MENFDHIGMRVLRDSGQFEPHVFLINGSGLGVALLIAFVMIAFFNVAR